LQKEHENSRAPRPTANADAPDNKRRWPGT
jgi:hypothetical protein